MGRINLGKPGRWFNRQVFGVKKGNQITAWIEKNVQVDEDAVADLIQQVDRIGIRDALEVLKQIEVSKE